MASRNFSDWASRLRRGRLAAAVPRRREGNAPVAHDASLGGAV
jgi:hypothetical protein